MADYLIITSSGGGGHKIAADALQHKKLQKDPANNLVQLDVMRSSCSYGTLIGKNCTNSWDKAQQRGDIKRQLQLVKCQPVAEAFFFIGTFFTVLHRLLKGEKLPKKVICTQPLHLLAITMAVRMANLIRFKEERKISKVHLYLTDLPTNKAEHFFGALRRLHFVSKRCFNMMRVHTPEPICQIGQTPAQFWKTQAHLQPHQVKVESMPVSAPFKNPSVLPLPGSALEYEIKLFSSSEKAEMDKVLGEQVDRNCIDMPCIPERLYSKPKNRLHTILMDKVGLLMPGCLHKRVCHNQKTHHRIAFLDKIGLIIPGRALEKKTKCVMKEKIEKNSRQFKIASEDKVGLLMLGSVPEKSAILDYVDGIAAAAKEIKESGRNYYFFVACGSKELNADDEGLKKDSLYKAVCKKIKEAQLPPRVKIIPFIGQPVAPIFGRSDLSITRSGGMTSAEILALKSREGDKKRVLIHSPLKIVPEGSQEEIRKELMGQIPLWENGNAEYLVKSPHVAAEVVNPKLAHQEFKAFFR